MTQKFKVGDKVKLLSELYRPNINGTYNKGTIHTILSINNEFIRINPGSPENGYIYDHFELVEEMKDIKLLSVYKKNETYYIVSLHAHGYDEHQNNNTINSGTPITYYLINIINGLLYSYPINQIKQEFEYVGMLHDMPESNPEIVIKNVEIPSSIKFTLPEFSKLLQKKLEELK